MDSLLAAIAGAQTMHMVQSSLSKSNKSNPNVYRQSTSGLRDLEKQKQQDWGSDFSVSNRLIIINALITMVITIGAFLKLVWQEASYRVNVIDR